LGDFRGDVEESDTTDISGISGTTSGQIKEEGESSASDKITPDTKSDEKKTEEEQKDEPMATVFATEEETEGGDLNEAEEVNSQPIIITEFVTDHTALTEALDPGTIVLPKGTLGCDEAFTMASGTASLTFQLEVQDGWDASTVRVEYRIQKEDGAVTDDNIKYDADWAEVTAPSGTYTIGRNSNNGLKGSEKRDCFSGPIEIRVIATRNTADLVIGEGVVGGVYLDGYGTDGVNKLLSVTESAIPFATFTKEITLLAKAEADETLEMKVTSQEDTTFSPMTRGGDVDVVGDEKKWTQFTIDPKTLTGYANEASEVSPSFTVRKTTDNPYFTYALSNEDGKYTLAVANTNTAKIPALTGVNYFTLTPGVGDAAATAPDRKTRRDYLKTENNTNVLVFEVTAAANTEVTGAKAELTLDPVAPATESKLLDTINATERSYADGAGTYYEINLGDVDSTLITGNVTLTLKADTVYKSEADNFDVHKITFAGDLDDVEIKDDVTNKNAFNADKALDTSTETDKDDFFFAVRAKEGYEISKGTNYNSAGGNSGEHVVTVSYTKQYKLQRSDNSYEYRNTKRLKKELILDEAVEDTGIYQLDGSVTGFVDATNKLLLKDGTGTKDWKTELTDITVTDYKDANAPFSYKDIIITVNTTTETNQSGKFNVVSEKLDYTVETGNGIEAGDTANTYTISEDAEFVVLNVTSPGGAPKVAYKGIGDASVPVAEKTMVKNGDSYQIKIPVAKMNGADTVYHGVNSNINSTITITEDTYSFTIETDDADNTFNGKLKVGDDTKESRKYTYSEVTTSPNPKNVITRGETVPVILYAETGTAFKSVKVVTGTGADATTEDITLGEDKTVLELSLAMTNDVEIQITTDAIYDVVLTRDGEVAPLEKDENGVYVIPVGAKNILATLMKGVTPQAIAYARLFDGGREAASTVQLVDTDSNTANGLEAAKIAQVSEKDTGVLRLDLAVKNGNKISVVASVQMRQEQAASKMSITNQEDGSAVTEYTAAPDTKRVEYNVKAEEGYLAFADSSVKLELAKDAGKVSAESVLEDGTALDSSDLKIDYNKATGKLGITVKPGVEGNKSYVLRFYDNVKRAEAAKNNAADRVCAVEGGTININITAPAVKSAGFTAKALDATNTTLRIEVASNDVVLDPANHNNVFYHVRLDSKDKLGAAGKDENGDAETITKRERYYQRTGDSQILEFKVNPTKTAKNEDYSDPQTFHPTVELVQTTACSHPTYVADKDINDAVAGAANKSANENEAERQAGINKLGKSDAVTLTTTTKEARYEHELSLSPDKTTVYLGQKEVTATTAQFGEKTGFAAVDSLEFVNVKTGARRSNAGDNVSYNNIKATIGRNGEIKISAEYAQAGDLKKYPDRYKDLGLKVSAAAGSNDTKPASAILSISVIAGVSTISFENGYNQNILKKPGKAATLKIKDMVNDGLKENAPKKKKFVYALGDASGKLSDEKNYTAPSDQVLNYVSVNQKNGTVTVKKDFAVDTNKAANNKFSVVAKEIYSNQRAYVTITVTEEAQSVSRVVIVDGSGNVVAADGVLKADDFYGKNLYVRALTGTAGTKRKYSDIDFQTPNNDYMTGVKYTSSAKNDLAVNAATGQLTLLKTPKKAVKLKAASADGSKDKGMSINVTVQGFSAVGLEITDSATGVDNSGKYSDPAVSYDGALNSIFTLQPKVRVNGTWQTPKQNYFKNWDIKIKKAKKVKLEKTATWWRIVKTSGTATVTITDKTNKSATMTYTIAQNPQADAKVKAPKITAATKLTQAAVDGARNAKEEKNGSIPLLFRIKGKVSYSEKSVMITPDYTKNKLLNKIAGSEEYVRANRIFFNNNNSKIVKVGEDNTFALPLTMWHRSNSEVVPGNYTLIATIGTYQNGKFVPETKGASIKVKIPGKAPKTLSLQLNGNYELDESGVPVDLATGITSGYRWSLSGNVAGNYAKNAINKETGKANKFTTFFEVKEKKDVNEKVIGYTLGLKGTNNKFEDIAKLRENPTDCQGYVTVVTDDGQRQDMLITVTLKDSEITSMTKDSYKGAEATVQFFAGGSSEPLELAGVYIDKKASQGAPSFVVASGGHVSNDDKKTVKIKLGSAVKDNSYEVTFKVLPAASAYAKASNKPATMTDTYVEKYGRTVTATFCVVDPAKAKGAVWFEPVNEENGLAFTAYSTDTYDKSRNTYSLDIKQKSAIDGANVSVAKIGTKKEDGSAFAGTTLGVGIRKKTGSSDVFTLSLDRDKFLKAADAENSIIGRGEEVAIPVELTYTNREIPTETVYVSVVMPDPKDVKAAVEAAQGAVADVEQIRVIDLNNRDVDEGTTIKAVLQKKVNEALMKAVPLDAVAYTNLPITIVDNKDEKGTVIGWKADLEIKEKRTDAAAKWSYTLKFEEEKKMPRAGELLNEIRALDVGYDGSAAAQITEAKINGIADNDHKLDNDYSADKLKADILKLLNRKALPADLDIVIENFKIKKATVKANGKVTAEIKVYDANTKVTSPNRNQYLQELDVDDAYGKARIYADITINKIGSIGDNGTLVKDAVDNYDPATKKGIDYQTVIYNAMSKAGADLDDVEKALETAIETAANNALTNSDVSVEFEEINVYGAYDNPNNDTDPTNRNVRFKLPEEDANGSVEFKLVLKQTGMTDYRIDRTSGSTLGAIAVAFARKDKDGNDTLPFQKLSEADTIITTTPNTLFGNISGGAYPLAERIDKATKQEIADEIEKMAAELLKGKGEFFVYNVDPATIRVVADGANVDTADEITPGSAAGDMKGTLTVTDKFAREVAKSYNFTGEVPQNTKTITGVKIGVTRTEGNKTAKVDVTDGIGGAEDTATVAGIGTEDCKITIKPELEGYWLAGDKGTYQIKAYANSDYTSNEITPTAAGGLSLNNGVITVDPKTVDDADSPLDIYVTVAAKLSSDSGVFPTTGDAFKQLKITCTFATPTTAAALFTDATFNSAPVVKVPYEENTGGGAWGVVDPTGEDAETIKAQLMAKATKWLTEENLGYEAFTVSNAAIAFDNSHPTEPTKATVIFTVKRTSDTDGTDAVDTGAIELDVEKTAKQVLNDIGKVVKDAADAARLSNSSIAIGDYQESDAKDAIKGASGVATALGDADITIIRHQTSGTTYTAEFVVTKDDVNSKEFSTTINVTGT